MLFFILCIVQLSYMKVEAQGNSLCTINFMPGAFCIFSLKTLVLSFTYLMQEIQYFQRGVYTMAMFTLLKLSALNVHV